MDARGTIAPNKSNTDKDNLHVRIDAVLTNNFPYKNNTAIPITLVFGTDRYTNAQIRATPNMSYPCWISNPRLKRDQEKIGEFLVKHGFKNKDKVSFKVRRSGQVPLIEIYKGLVAATITAQTFPEEIDNPKIVVEGAKKSVVVNKYERDAKARKTCIDSWGCKCSACGLDFGEMYGDLGAGFIHVHHLNPISEIGEEYELNPVNDLRPVCPNCHAMIHRTSPILSVEELKSVLDENAQKVET